MSDLTQQLADALEEAKSDFRAGMDKIVRQYEDRGNGSWAGTDDNFLHLKVSADKIDAALAAYRAQGQAKSEVSAFTVGDRVKFTPFGYGRTDLLGGVIQDIDANGIAEILGDDGVRYNRATSKLRPITEGRV